MEIENLKEDLKALADARCQLTEKLKATNYNLKCKLEEKTHELCTLMEKHNRQSVLLEAVEKEAFSVRQVVEETRACIQQKEEEVSSFGKSLMKVFEFEGTFLERFDELEERLKLLSSELTTKNELIMALEKKLEAAVNDHAVKAEHEILKQSVETKESLILMLRQEKEVLLESLKNQDMIIERFQTTIVRVDESATKYQQEILTLQRESETLEDRLKETERSLREAADKYQKLVAEMQDQRHSFSAQKQLWEDERANLEGKVHKLEAKLSKDDCLLQKHVGGDKQTTITDKCQDTCTTHLFCGSDDVSTKDRSPLVSESEGTYYTTCNLMKNTARNNSQISETFAELEDNILDGGTQLDHISQHTKRLEAGSSVNVSSILKRLGRPMTLVRSSESIDVMQTEKMRLEAPKIVEPASKSNEKNCQDGAPAQGCIQLEPLVTHSHSEAQFVLADASRVREQLPSIELDESGGEDDGPEHEFVDDGQKQDKAHSIVEAQTLLSVSSIPSSSTPMITINEVEKKAEAFVQKLEEQHSERAYLVSEGQQTLEFPNPSTSIDSDRPDYPASQVDWQLEDQNESTFKLRFNLTESSRVPGKEPLLRLENLDIEQENDADVAHEGQQKELPNLGTQLKLPVTQQHSEEPNPGRQPSAHEVDEHQENERKSSTHLLSTSFLEKKRRLLMCGKENIDTNHAAVVERQPGKGGSESCPATALPITFSASLPENKVATEGFPLDAAYESIPEMNISEQCSINGDGSSQFDAQFTCSTHARTEPKSRKKKAFVPPSSRECFCNLPPYGYMVKCKVCETQFHAACMQTEENVQGESYTCSTCKEQRHRKRRQLQVRQVSLAF